MRIKIWNMIREVQSVDVNDVEVTFKSGKGQEVKITFRSETKEWVDNKINYLLKNGYVDFDKKCMEEDEMKEITMEPENEIKNEKIRVTSVKISVRKIKDKQYYEIEYYKENDDELYIGYGSFSILTVSGWFTSCFELVGGVQK